MAAAAAAAAPAAAHMADVSWKMLELRARSKRSGLTPWLAREELRGPPSSPAPPPLFTNCPVPALLSFPLPRRSPRALGRRRPCACFFRPPPLPPPAWRVTHRRPRCGPVAGARRHPPPPNGPSARARRALPAARVPPRGGCSRNPRAEAAKGGLVCCRCGTRVGCWGRGGCRRRGRASGDLQVSFGSTVERAAACGGSAACSLIKGPGR